MTDPQLMEYFKFDEADVFANRSGLFTEKQKARLISEDKSTKTCSMIAGGFLLLIALFGLAVAIVAGIATPDWGFRIGFGLGFGCIWPLCWGGVGGFLLSRAFQKFEVKLQSVEGPINIIKVQRTSTTRSGGHMHTRHYFVYEIHVGGQKFNVTSQLADIMMQGDVYTLYYTEGSEREILSAELVSKANYGVPVAPAAGPDDDPRIIELINNGKMLDAIKAYRENTGASLEEAKQAVEEMQSRHGL